MDIAKATRKYEAWLADHIPLVKTDLALKHQYMRDHPFLFLRATFYRWAQRWPKVCRSLVTAPPVLAVADLHIENFGTWRDREGRLIWGVNDFDEVFTLPYTTISYGWPPASHSLAGPGASRSRPPKRVRLSCLATRTA